MFSQCLAYWVCGVFFLTNFNILVERLTRTHSCILRPWLTSWCVLLGLSYMILTEEKSRRKNFCGYFFLWFCIFSFFIFVFSQVVWDVSSICLGIRNELWTHMWDSWFSKYFYCLYMAVFTQLCLDSSVMIVVIHMPAVGGFGLHTRSTLTFMCLSKRYSPFKVSSRNWKCLPYSHFFSKNVFSVDDQGFY